jgi:hypothetical protein
VSAEMDGRDAGSTSRRLYVRAFEQSTPHCPASADANVVVGLSRLGGDGRYAWYE